MCLCSPLQRGRKLAAGFWGVNEGADGPQMTQINAELFLSASICGICGSPASTACGPMPPVLRQRGNGSQREQQKTSNHGQRPDWSGVNSTRENVAGAGEQDHECGDWQYEWVPPAPEKSGEPIGSHNNRA